MYWVVLMLGGLATGDGDVPADTLDRRLENANRAYVQGRYARAEEGYRTILQAGATSGALYYNLGNTYVRLDQLGQAIRYYEKARTLRPRDPRVRHNLEQARRRAGVYPGTLPARGIRGVVRDWPPLALFVAGLLLLGGGGAVAVLWARPGAGTPVRHPLVWGAVTAGLLLVGSAMGVSYVQSQDGRAVVVADRASLSGAPDRDAPADTTLPEGTMVGVQGQRDPWTEVRLGNGAVGWIPATALGEI